MTFGERLKELRKENNMTQQEFADKLRIKRPTIANYEADRVEPSSSVIGGICREFKVNEIWLRTGEGEMHQALTEDEEIAAFAGEVLAAAPEDIRKRLISSIAKWTPEMWTLAEKIADQLENKEHPDG